MSETVAAAERRAARTLASTGLDEPALEARLLAQAATGLDRAALIADPGRALTAEQAARFEALLARWAARAPMAYLLGRQGFWSLEIETSPDALIPRPETEHVVELALAAIAADAPARVLDLGVGTGAILLAILSERTEALGVGVDRSEAAAHLATRNAVRLGLGARANMVVGDWGEAIAAEFDVIVANPPYIPSDEIAGLQPEVRAEPRLALDGGADGLDAFRRIAADVSRLLAAGGSAIVETGAGQTEAVARLFDAAQGLQATEIVRDLGGKDRIVVAARQGARRC